MHSIQLIVLFFAAAFCRGDGSDVREMATRVLDEQVQNGYAGSVLISHHNKVVFDDGFGYTSKSEKVEITVATLFNIASISKSITAIAILKLYEDDKLSFDQTIGEFLDNVPTEMQPITVHQLLTHTSGLPQAYPNSNVKQTDKAVQNIFKQELTFAPGTDFRYSNLNYDLLGIIIEKVSEMQFEDFVRKNVLEPIGMKQTFFWDEVDHHDIEHVAQKQNRFLRNKHARCWDHLSSGGMFSTTGDLLLLQQAIQSHKILKEESVALMLSKHKNIRSGLDMGYGWFIKTYADGTEEIWTRGTESFGHNAVLRWFPKQGMVIIVPATLARKAVQPRQTIAL